jgi:dienelactone hydrolase
LRFLIALLCAVSFAPGPAALAQGKLGIVVLHGKRGIPDESFITDIVHPFERAGYFVDAPEVCWSQDRIYDRTFDDCMTDIDAAVARLRAKGSSSIVVGGLSTGGFGALGYGARRPGLAGIMSLAPTPHTHHIGENKGMPESIARARQLFASGHADERNRFADWTTQRNGPSGTGGRFEIEVTTTPRIYLSFMEPDGPASEEANIARLSAPLFMAWSLTDVTQQRDDELFALAPANPLNRKVLVDSDHMGTGAAAVPAMLVWLKTLPPPR